MDLKKALKAIKDTPLNHAERELFVDREQEVVALQTAVSIYSGEVIGLCGERGIGKTTLLNMVSFSGKEKIIVNVIDRETKVGIISDIIYAVYAYGKKKRDKEVEKRAFRAFEILTKSISKKAELGLSYLLTAKIEMEKKDILIKGSALLKEIIELLPNVVFVLDEIDKEKKEELILIIDAIKDAFRGNEATLVVTLPYTIYEEYLLSKETEKETFNLENVFSEVLLLHPLSPDAIRELIARRFDTTLIDEDALELIVEYARGNPRRAISTLKESGLYAVLKGNKRITYKDVEGVVRKYIKVYISSVLDEKGIKALRFVEEGKRAEVVKKLRNGLQTTLSSSYRYLTDLEKAGFLKVKDGYVYLSPLTKLVKKVFRNF